MKAFRVMGRVFKATYDELFLVVGLSVAWWVGTILIVTSPMTAAGVHKAANRIANYKRAGFEFFWEGARSHVAKAILLFLLVVLIPPLLIFSINFYIERQGWFLILGVIMGWVTLFMLLGGQYFYPLFWQQTEPSLKLILRNGLLLAIQHPIYSLLMLLFQVLLIGLSFVLVVPVLLLMPGMVALAQNLALVGLLQEQGLASQPPEMSGT